MHGEHGFLFQARTVTRERGLVRTGHSISCLGISSMISLCCNCGSDLAGR